MQAAAETARGEAAEAGARADALAAELEALHRTHAQEALARQRARTPTAIVVEVVLSTTPRLLRRLCNLLRHRKLLIAYVCEFDRAGSSNALMCSQQRFQHF